MTVAPAVRLLRARAGWPNVAPGLAAAAVVTVVALADGGLFPRTWRLATIALLALAAAALLARERVVVTRLEWATIGALAAFTAWIAASTVWSEHPESALLEAERSLTYVAAVFAVVVLAERASLAHLLAGVLAGTTAVAAFGLALYLFTSPPLDPFQGRLLHQPIGYANALGIFVAIGVLLSAGLALAASRPALRAAALAPLIVLVPALALTSSRGASVALAAGIVVLAAFAGHRRVAVALVALLLSVGAALAATSDVTSDNRVDYWRVALRQYEDNPVLGAGAGTYLDYWFRYRSIASFTRTSHNLYLESLGELGPLGLLLVATALALPLVALARRRDALVATAGAAYAAFVLHLALDWDWELPAPTLTGLFCGAAVLAATRTERAPELSRRSRLALVVPAFGLILLAAIRFATGGDIPFGS
jgi:O-antigen ligase